MAKQEILYWQCKNPLGGGANSINQGDEIKNYDDKRLAEWKENGTVSNKQVITFSEKKNEELETAKAENAKLKQENAALKDKGVANKKVAKLETANQELIEKTKKLEEANQTLTDNVTKLTEDLDEATT